MTLMDVIDRELERLHCRLVHAEADSERYFLESQIAKLVTALVYYEGEAE